MSFYNTQRLTKTYEDKYKKQYKGCPYCTEDVEVKWYKREANGKSVFYDEKLQAVHVCKDKFIKYVTCNRCERTKLRWRRANTPSGWELYELDGRSHDCYSGPKVSEKDKLLAKFYNENVVTEEDTEVEKQKKIKNYSRLAWNPSESEQMDMKILYEQYHEYYTSYTYSG